MKYFCSKCGKTTQYGFELPKFCAFCGQSFASQVVSPQVEEKKNKFLNELKLKKNINVIKNEIDNEEDASDLESLTHTDFKKIKASFKVDIYKSKGESFGNLIENPSPIEDVNTISNNISPKTNEEILKEFQKEAGLSRNQE
jgi:hypothetical protein